MFSAGRDHLEIRAEAERKGLDPLRFLADDGSYHFLETCDGLLKTGLTNTNACDLHLVLVTSGLTEN